MGCNPKCGCWRRKGGSGWIGGRRLEKRTRNAAPLLIQSQIRGANERRLRNPMPDFYGFGLALLPMDRKYDLWRQHYGGLSEVAGVLFSHAGRKAGKPARRHGVFPPPATFAIQLCAPHQSSSIDRSIFFQCVFSSSSRRKSTVWALAFSQSGAGKSGFNVFWPGGLTVPFPPPPIILASNKRALGRAFIESRSAVARETESGIH